MTWYLTVKTKSSGEHHLRLGDSEDEAIEALSDAKTHIGKQGTVTIRNRLAVRAEDIIAVLIRNDREPRAEDIG